MNLSEEAMQLVEIIIDVFESRMELIDRGIYSPSVPTVDPVVTPDSMDG